MTTPYGRSAAYLRDMFCASLEYGATNGAWWEWYGTENADQFLWRERDGGRWSKLGTMERALWVAEQLLESVEEMPEHVLTLLGLEPGQTYGQVARRLYEQVARRESGTTDSPDTANASVTLRVEIPRDLMEQLTATSARMGVSLDDAVRYAIADWIR
jgi:hypothetical protein